MVRTAAVALVLALPATLMTTGCATDGGTGSGTGGSITDSLVSSLSEQITGNWNLQSLGDQSINQLMQMAGLTNPPSMSIGDDGTVSGFSGVNRFTGGLDLSQIASGDFDLGQLASTRMAGSPGAMSLEDQFLSALGNVQGFDVSSLTDGVLSLLGDNGQELMRFVRPS